VQVELRYEWDPLPGDEGTGMGVRLVPGANMLDAETVNEGAEGRDGVMYEPEVARQKHVANDGASMLDRGNT
jgi:hypothetical protein